ncbi:hypothetical protein ACOMCU_25625 [Lysinibacillus sp. UGB7]|uniref:hypothetical protein n=1 Tax=Lysinibacillus sp. UGB7 TaxID=3411039 RepID=UPI003B7E2086
MQLNQEEYTNLLIMVCGVLGATGELGEIFSTEQLEKIQNVADDYMGNTTINEIKSVSESAINKLFTLATNTEESIKLWRDEQR